MLTTERQQFEEWLKFHSDEEECTNLLQRNSAGTNYLHPHADLAWIAWQASRELLANREARPVALVDRRPAASGGICWQHGGKDLPHGTELFTAPPAPVVPEEISSSIRHLKDTLVACNRFNYCADAVNRVEDACRAAMLAAAPEVSRDDA